MDIWPDVSIYSEKGIQLYKKRAHWVGDSFIAYAICPLSGEFFIIVYFGRLYNKSLENLSAKTARVSAQTFLAASPPGIAVLTTSSTLSRRDAPEQGARPDTV